MYAESITHVWRNLGISDARQDFFGIPLLDCLKNNYECHFFRSLICIGRLRTPKAIWLIWLQRNKFTFQSRKIDPNTYSHCIKKGAEFFAIVPDDSNKPNRAQVQVKWKKPIPNWVKLNKEESIFGKPKKAGGRRVLHSSNEEWISSFERKLGTWKYFRHYGWAMGLKDGLFSGSAIEPWALI